MVNKWCNKSKTYLNQALPIFFILLILFFSSIYGLFSYKEAGAQSDVLVIPEEPDIQEVTLELGGQSCDVNRAESAVLHLRGILMVDIELKPGYLIVGYDRLKVTTDDMVLVVGKQSGAGWFCTATVAR